MQDASGGCASAQQLRRQRLTPTLSSSSLVRSRGSFMVLPGPWLMVCSCWWCSSRSSSSSTIGGPLDAPFAAAQRVRGGESQAHSTALVQRLQDEHMWVAIA
jgi:hypothetical protein